MKHFKNVEKYFNPSTAERKHRDVPEGLWKLRSEGTGSVPSQ